MDDGAVYVPEAWLVGPAPAGEEGSVVHDVTMSVSLPSAFRDAITEAAGGLGINRSEWMRRAAAVCLLDPELITI